jgi:hypothetical protein
LKLSQDHSRRGQHGWERGLLFTKEPEGNSWRAKTDLKNMAIDTLSQFSLSLVYQKAGRHGSNEWLLVIQGFMSTYFQMFQNMNWKLEVVMTLNYPMECSII